MQTLKHRIIQNGAGIMEGVPISDDRNEDMKTEIDVEEHNILEESSELHLCVEMEAVVKPEPVWLLEDQAMLDDMKREAEPITFADIKHEFLRTNILSRKHKIIQNDAGIKVEAPISYDINEDMKTEIDVKEHSILEESSEYIPSHKGSNITDALEYEKISINTDESNRTVTKRMKSRTGDKRFKCEECSKFFTQRSHLTEHIRTHTGDKPFKCEVCSKCFTHRGDLPRHIRTHTGDKPFKCALCSKCFTQRSILTDHVRTHIGDKPFKCEVCSKCFTHRGGLSRHLRTHTGDRPFTCDVCSKCFTERKTLNDHIRTHNGDKPFKCEVCGKCFIQRSNFTRHLIIHN